MRKRRILFVINTLGRAGAEAALLQVLRSIDPERNQVELFVLLGQGELVTELPDTVRLLNRTFDTAPVHSAEGRRSLLKKTARAFVRAGLPQIPYLVKNGVYMLRSSDRRPENLAWRVFSKAATVPEGTYDLAVAFLEGGATYYVADRVSAKKKAAVLHVDYSRAGYSRSLDRDCYRKFDRIFSVSDEVRASFLKIYPELADRTGILQNIVDQEEIRRRAKEPGGFPKEWEGPVLLTVGRLTPQKGLDTAIRAMAELKKRGVSARWVVLGEGALRESLTALAAELDLSDCFLFPGAAANPYPYMKQCTVYVHATEFEGRSIAIQEAMTLSCAVVASDRSGNRSQITDGVDGLLCPFSPEGIADAVERVLSDQRLRERLGKAASEKTYAGKEETEKLLRLMEEDDVLSEA